MRPSPARSIALSLALLPLAAACGGAEPAVNPVPTDPSVDAAPDATTDAARDAAVDSPSPDATDATDAIGPGTPGATSVLTQHNDNARTGADLEERTLDTTTVSSKRFGLLYSRPVVGQLYAQPLYAPRVSLGKTGPHAVVYLATEHNDVYAYDAKDERATIDPVWHVQLGDPLPNAELPNPDYCPDLAPEIGITSTPVIDVARNVIFVETKSKQPGGVAQQLHALDLSTGEEMLGGPITIAATIAGTGRDAALGVITFDPMVQLQRPALTLANGVLWLAFGSHCDAGGGPFHGWVLAYDARTLAQIGAWIDTPDGDAGGIWMAGQGLAASEDGDVYFVSGNGTFQESPLNVADSIGRLRAKAGAGITLVDYFTPFNQQALSDGDIDLGAAGPMLLPHTEEVIGGGKEGRFYLLDRAKMGHFHAGDDSQIVQSWQATQGDPTHHIHGSPVFYEAGAAPRLYVWGENDFLRAFRFRAGRFDPTPIDVGAVRVPLGMPGGILSLSADGARAGTAIVWASHAAVENHDGEKIVDGVLRAFDALTLTHELWNSATDPADAVGLFAKFCPPTIADGRVYMATFSGKLQVYGVR